MKRITRRRFFEQAMRTSAVGAVGGSILTVGAPSLIRRAQAADVDLQDAALAGVAYFRSRNEEQMVLVDNLRSAIAGGDLAAIRQSYVDARPPYEEIETLAASFEDSDSDIDARPYSFDGGETSEDFRGFHKIEYLVFRDDDLEMAAAYADTLAESHRRLHEELAEPDRYSPTGSFEGMIGLSEEIGSKKISSEEETWSDQSVLIFKSNIIGIFSQYEPFSPLVVAQSEAADTAVRDAYTAFRAILEPMDVGPGAAMLPYSQVRTAERKMISDATYRLRDALIEAGGQLGVV